MTSIWGERYSKYLYRLSTYSVRYDIWWNVMKFMTELIKKKVLLSLTWVRASISTSRCKVSRHPPIARVPPICRASILTSIFKVSRHPPVARVPSFCRASISTSRFKVFKHLLWPKCHMWSCLDIHLTIEGFQTPTMALSVTNYIFSWW